MALRRAHTSAKAQQSPSIYQDPLVISLESGENENQKKTQSSKVKESESSLIQLCTRM